MGSCRTVLDAARSIRVEEAATPAGLAPDHVRLRLATASICGTDMHYFRHFANAGFALERPLTLGHEACAYVEDGNGHGFDAGQLVAINPVIACGACDACRRGAINMCPGKRFPGSGTTRPHIDGFFRDRFDFPARCCQAVGDGVDPDHLTFAEPLACALHAVDRARVRGGDRVLVAGCGPMGLLAAIVAIGKGAEVHAADLNPRAVEAAERAGAHRGFVVDEAGAGVPADGYDIVIEASGSPRAYNLALEAVRKQGTVAVLSVIQPSDTPIHLHLGTLKETVVVGSILFTSEFADAVALVESGGIDFDAMTAARFPLAEAQAAFDMVAEGRAAGKALLKPSA